MQVSNCVLAKVEDSLIEEQSPGEIKPEETWRKDVSTKVGKLMTSNPVRNPSSCVYDLLLIVKGTDATAIEYGLTFRDDTQTPKGGWGADFPSKRTEVEPDATMIEYALLHSTPHSEKREDVEPDATLIEYALNGPDEGKRDE